MRKEICGMRTAMNVLGKRKSPRHRKESKALIFIRVHSNEMVEG